MLYSDSSKSNLVCVNFNGVSSVWVDLKAFVLNGNTNILNHLLNLGYSMDKAQDMITFSQVIEGEGEIGCFFANKYQHSQNFFNADSAAMEELTAYDQSGCHNIEMWAYCVDTTNTIEAAELKVLNTVVIEDMDLYIDETIFANYRESDPIYMYFNRESYINDCCINGEFKKISDDCYLLVK